MVNKEPCSRNFSLDIFYIGLQRAKMNINHLASTLPETKIFAPENRPFAPKGNDRIPTIHFQVPC